MRCSRAEPYTPLPGGSGHRARRRRTGAWGCCHWGWDRRQSRVTPAGNRVPGKPGLDLSLLGLASLWREPRWTPIGEARPLATSPAQAGEAEEDKGASRVGKTARRCRTQRLSAFCFPFFACDSAAETEGSRLALRVSGEISESFRYRHSPHTHGARRENSRVNPSRSS